MFEFLCKIRNYLLFFYSNEDILTILDDVSSTPIFSANNDTKSIFLETPSNIVKNIRSEYISCLSVREKLYKLFNVILLLCSQLVLILHVYVSQNLNSYWEFSYITVTVFLIIFLISIYGLFGPSNARIKLLCNEHPQPDKYFKFQFVTIFLFYLITYTALEMSLKYNYSLGVVLDKFFGNLLYFITLYYIVELYIIFYWITSKGFGYIISFVLSYACLSSILNLVNVWSVTGSEFTLIHIFLKANIPLLICLSLLLVRHSYYFFKKLINTRRRQIN